MYKTMGLIATTCFYSWLTVVEGNKADICFVFQHANVV